MPLRIVRISKPSKVPRGQWTFKGKDGQFTWVQTNGDGVIIQESRRPLPTLDAARLDAAARGWTPKSSGLAYKVE